MLKQDIKFTNFNGEERTATEYFNLSETEITKLQIETEGGIQAGWQEAADSEDRGKLYLILVDLIDRSYGKKSPDGLYFQKSEEILNQFKSSAVYDAFILSLFENEGEGALNFMKGIFPKSIVDRAGDVFGAQTPTVPTLAPSAREVFEQRTVVQAPEHFNPKTATESPKSTDDADFQAYLAWKASQGTEAGQQ